MKNSFQSFLLVVLTVLMPAKMLAQEPYAVLTDENTVLRFYYDDQKDVRGGMSVGPFSSSDEVSWYENRESITSVVFDASFADCTTLTSTAYWFFFFTNLTSITGISNLKTDNVTNMEGMFWRCSILTSLDLSSFNTAKVTHIGWMFYECWSLTSLNVSSFNTENVTDMCSMFGFCRKLTNLDLSSFNTSNVTRMESMFVGCESLTALDVTGFITEKVTNMTQMFMGCVGLKNLDLSNFNTANVTDMYMMFYSNPSLKTIYVGNDWSTASVTNSDYMFEECPALIGGAGTKYSEDHVDHSYAHIDGGTTNPGYFTESGAEPFVYPTEPYAVLSNENTVLTFYYDDQKDARGGMSVGPFEASSNTNNIPWYDIRESITSVVFDASFADCTTLVSTAYWFLDCKNLTSITGISNLKTDNVTDMQYMFKGCYYLPSLNLSTLNTGQVTNMQAMFWNCGNLTSLDVSGFNTQNVTSMLDMFSNCSALTSLDLSGFNTANVTSMESMFSYCSGLTSLDVSGFNTEKVWSMSSMFSNCSSLTSLDLSGFNTANVTHMGYMFYNCPKLKYVYVGSNWSIASVTYSENMFLACSVLVGGAGTHYDADHIDYTYAHIDGGTTNPGYFTAAGAEPWADSEPYVLLSDGNTVLTFYYDDQKTARGGMDVGPFDTSDSQSWYDERESITSVVFDASFAGCTTLTSTAWWFNQLNNLTTITGINYLKTDNVTSMRSMFHRCSSLTSLDLSSFNTENVTVMQDMFSSCTALTSLDLSNFNTENVTDMQEMFLSCSALTALDLSSFNTANVTKMGAMFEQCEALTSLNVSSFNTINVTDMYEMFRDTALPSLDLSNFNTTNVTDMGQMFDGCSALTSIDVSSFNTANVSDIHRMFYDCSHLETIYVGNDWSTASVTSGDGMFTNCTALVGGKGTTYDENHTDYTYAHIDGGTTNPGYFTDKNAVDATFDSMGVLTVGGSTTMTDALEAVGGGAEVAKTITAIVWNSTETLTNSDLQGLDNPNMLIFVNEASVAPDHSNVVIDGQAKEIILKDVTEGNNNWYCPQPFTAEKISYTRTFSQQTKIGVSRGWETIALPFDVQTISHATQGIISPFGNYSGNYNFWLRTLTQNGLQSVQEIKANTPYIISMPNSSEYPVEYNLAGEVTFSAENAFVPETENYFVESENYAMAPIFMYIEAKEELYVLNVGEERNNHPEGSIFERNYRAVRPFEAATQHMNPSRFAPQFISVADLGGGDDTTELQELKNGRMEELKYYDLQGRRVLKPSKGVYIQNGNKVIIK